MKSLLCFLIFGLIAVQSLVAAANCPDGQCASSGYDNRRDTPCSYDSDCHILCALVCVNAAGKCLYNKCYCEPIEIP